jgi:hypothetical protein
MPAVLVAVEFGPGADRVRAASMAFGATNVLFARSPAIFRARTGIVGVPSLLVVRRGAVAVVATGVPEAEMIRAVGDRLLSQQAGKDGVLVRKGSGGQLLGDGQVGDTELVVK